MDNIIEHFQDWNQAQIIGLILSLGFVLGFIWSILNEINIMRKK